MAVDLNELRNRVLENQHNGESLPSAPHKQVGVTKDGRVVMGDEDTGNEPVTQVQQDTFAGEYDVQI